MLRGKENSNVNLLGVLVVMAGLLFSSVIPIQTSVQAEGFQANPETRKIAVSEQAIEKDYGKMPLIFEENKGQTDAKAKFISRGSGYTLYLTETEAVFSLKVPSPKSQDSNQLENPKTAKKEKTKSDVLRMKFLGANQQPTIEGIDEAITKTNYYIGKKRFENVPNYEQVNYKNLYNGIDTVFYGNANNQLEYDFVVAPNTDANQIGLDFDGAENISVDEQGNLVVKTENTELVQQKPFAYQETDGERKEIASRYVVSENTVRFELGEYDKSNTLVIDPAIGYLTYLGGSGAELIGDIKVDQFGNAFVAGSTSSTNFPGPNSGSGNVGFAAFVSKISPDGQSIIYTTFLDGSDVDGQNAFNIGVVRPDIAIDSAGNAYIAGGTDSEDFPVTTNAYQTTRRCNRTFFQCTFPEEGFVTKLNSQGNIVYSTFLGGKDSDYLHSIAVDSAGRAYVTGGTYSGATFPTKNRFQGTGVFGSDLDAFLTVFNADGSDILYSTGFGGNDSDLVSEIALDSSNNVYIVGETFSKGSFPTKNPFQSENGGGRDAFVAKFNTSLSGNDSLIYSTFIGGGGGEIGFGIAIDASGQAHITGLTGSFDFPLKNAFRSTNQINEAFVTVLNSSGNALVNSSFLGGSNQEEGRDIALGKGGVIYVTGNTLSSDFPTALPFQAAKAGDRDAFITKLKFGTGVMTSSFLGGNGFDRGDGIAILGNRIFVTGFTGSNDLATTSGVLQPNPGASSNNADGFVAKILDTRKDTIGTFNPANTVFNLKNTLAGGAPDIVVDRGAAGDVPVAGDFNGDGIDTVSTFNNGVWKISNFNVAVGGYGVGSTTVNFGATGDLPVVGDWNGDGIDTVGVFRPLTGQFLLSNSLTAAPPTDITVIFGTNGDKPVAGDWDGDGIDSTGVFRPTANQFFLTNDNVLGANLDITTNFGSFEDLPVAGDFDGNGTDSIGVWRPSVQTFFLTNDNFGLTNTIVFGASNDRPVIGDWDGKPNQ